MRHSNNFKASSQTLSQPAVQLERGRAAEHQANGFGAILCLLSEGLDDLGPSLDLLDFIQDDQCVLLWAGLELSRPPSLLDPVWPWRMMERRQTHRPLAHPSFAELGGLQWSSRPAAGLRRPEYRDCPPANGFSEYEPFFYENQEAAFYFSFYSTL